MGKLSCWGYNCNGQLGCSFDATVSSQNCTPFASGSSVVQISTGTETSCARLLNGQINCWGRNDAGQVGNGSFGLITQCGDTNADCFAPNPTVGINNAVALATGAWDGCAVLSDGSLQCWGNNASGQIGAGSTPACYAPTPIPGIDGSNDTSFAVSVAAAGDHTCVLMHDGSIQCFGLVNLSQLDGGVIETSDTPILAQPPMTASFVATGDSFTCFLTTEGSVRCWGANDRGQLGDGSFTDSSSPVTVKLPAATVVAKLIAKSSTACALTNDGRVFCWGANDFGQLGIGTTVDSAIPVELASP